VLIGQRGGVSKSFALATALTERLMDAILLVLICAVALLTLGSLPDWMGPTLRLMAAAGTVGAVGILLAPRLGGLSQAVIAKLPLREGLRAKLAKGAASFLLGAAALQHWGRMGLFLLFSSAIWTLDMLTALQTARAFELDLSPALALVLLAALGLSSALPSTPGYVGVYQFVAVSVLTPFGFSQSQALVYILAYQGINYAVICVWGLLGLYRLRK
jgi:glycosyltransferase 2 family protein